MQPIRHVGIPLEHVTAEIAAFPLANLAAMRLGVNELDPYMNGNMPALWREAERELIGHFPGFLVDEMVAMRDRMWFQLPADADDGIARSRRSVPLHEYLKKLADELIEVHGAVAAPRLLNGQAPDGKLIGAVLPKRRRTWRWLTFALPADLLLAALKHQQAPPDAVELLSPTISKMLRDRGYAETHLHVGAGLDFPTLWVSAQLALARPEMKSDSLQSPGAELNEGRDLAPWLVRALIARYVLGAYLAAPNGAVDFQSYLLTVIRDAANATYLPNAFTTIVAALADLRNGRLNDAGSDFVAIQSAYGVLSEALTAPWPSNFADRDQADRLFGLLPPPMKGQPTTEVRFVRAALAHLEKLQKLPPCQRDPMFTSLFWQVVRVRNLFYRHITQRPMTPGLLWFIRFYGRISAARRPLATQVQIESAATIGGRGQGLRALEFRTAPSESMEENLAYLEVAAKLWRQWHQDAKTSGDSSRNCELGVVLHFTKERGGDAANGVPRAFWRTSNADPYSDKNKSGNSLGFRFSDFRAKKMREATALASVLTMYPLTIQVLRGLDVCTDEMGVPNWVFVPVLKTVRDAAHIAAGVVRAKLGLNLPPLRTTIHAGEDFIHLQTGLRGVAEAIDHLELREGDRIGHGVSLGIDPRQWSREFGRIAMYLEDRLLDLVWEWTWHGCRHGSPIVARQHVLEREIAELSERLFGRVIAPYQLEQLRRDLCNSSALKLVGYDSIGSFTTFAHDDNPRLWLLHQYLSSRALFDRGRELIWVDVASEEENLVHLQGTLRERVGSLGIAVEVNPTSNLLIGNLDDLTNHPMWRLRSPRPNSDPPPPVSVCIGSDDPITFNSNLRQEYQCLADAMALAGLSDEEASQWLERTRLCGMEHRFTLNQLVLDAASPNPLRDVTHFELA